MCNGERRILGGAHYSVFDVPGLPPNAHLPPLLVVRQAGPQVKLNSGHAEVARAILKPNNGDHNVSSFHLYTWSGQLGIV